MFCPRCAHLSQVIRTLKLNSPNKVIRTRRCPSCGFYFCTQETLDQSNTPPPPLQLRPTNCPECRSLTGKVKPAFCRLKASPPSHRLYPSLLKDRLQNYDLDVSHLPTITARALSSNWKPGKLDLHYTKHNPDFAFIFPSARLYSKAAKALIEDETAIKCLRLEEDRLILLVFLQDPESRKKAWYYVVCDLEKGVIRSFYKKKNKAIQKILKDLDIKQMLFTPSVGATGGSPALDLIKKESLMLQSDIDQALGELEELHTIDSYEDVIRMVKTKDEDDVLTYAEDLFSDRSDNLFILINAGLLSPEQLARIKKVDAFLLSHPVPYQLQPLKDWLAKHQVEASS